MYISTGSFCFEIHRNVLLLSNQYTIDLTTIGTITVLTTLFFKLGNFPFHIWICDVYEGSMLPTTVLFAIVPKTALLYVFFKLFVVTFHGYENITMLICFVTGNLSIVIASIGALYQKRFKRLLALSSISHVGYLIIAIACLSIESIRAVYFYLVIYVISSFATFALICLSYNNYRFLRYIIN
jgi:NADH-quinone oxidoreductase subunit N